MKKLATLRRAEAALPRPLLERWAVWIGVLLLTLYLVFVGGSLFGIYFVQLRQISVLLAGIGLAAWTIAATRSRSWRPRSALVAALAACLFSLALSTLTSRFPRISAEYLGYAVLLAALYLLLVQLLARPFFRTRFGAVVVGLCLGISGLYLALVAEHWIDWWTVVGRLTVPPLRPDFEGLTYGNPSAVLTISVLFLGSAVAHIGTETRARLAIVIILTLLVGSVALLTGSRAGWLALAASVVIVGGAWLLAGPGRAQLAAALGIMRRHRGMRWAVAVGATVLLLAGVALAPAILRRAASGGEELRVGYVVAALRMFVEAPLAGTGPGTWVAQRIRYTVAPETDYYVPHAHDIYAQTLSELGLVGAAAGIVLVAFLAWLVRNAILDRDPTRRRWGWLTAFTLVYFGAHQVLDFYANMPAVLFAAALPVAWLDATSHGVPRLGGRAAPIRLGRLAATFGVVLVLTAVIGLELSEIPAASHAEAVDLANSGDWAAADAPARAATAMDPSLPPYHLTEGLTASRLGDHVRAADAFRLVVAADDLPEAWLDLAAEEAASGDLTSARAAIVDALRLGYQRPAVALPAGDLALRLADRDLAREAFVAALETTPSLAGDPWWQQDPLRATMFPEIRDAAISAVGPAAGWEIALVSGDTVNARALAAQLDPGTAAADERIIAAWSGDRTAFEKALDACAADPLNVTGLQWCARLEGHAGNDTEANRYRFWASVITSTSSVGAAELRVTPAPQIGRSGAGNPAIFYFQTYRRLTPWDLLVPSLVHLTLG